MVPWWDNTWLWMGISIVTFAAIAAIVAILIVVAFTTDHQRPRV